jgi:hypothetical protein
LTLNFIGNTRRFLSAAFVNLRSSRALISRCFRKYKIILRINMDVDSRLWDVVIWLIFCHFWKVCSPPPPPRTKSLFGICMVDIYLLGFHIHQCKRNWSATPLDWLNYLQLVAKLQLVGSIGQRGSTHYIY